jgi:hypothetical protein
VGIDAGVKQGRPLIVKNTSQCRVQVLVERKELKARHSIGFGKLPKAKCALGGEVIGGLVGAAVQE